MTMIQTLETNQQYEGKTVVLGCINYSITDLLLTNMNSGNLVKRDVDFYLPVNTQGWQKWYDSHISLQNDTGVKSSFIKKKDIYSIDYSDTGDIGIAIVEAPDADYAIKLINKVTPSIKESGLIIVPYTPLHRIEFVSKINSEFDAQYLVHLENYSYINFIKGKVPLNKNKKISRSRSILT